MTSVDLLDDSDRPLCEGDVVGAHVGYSEQDGGIEVEYKSVEPAAAASELPSPEPPCDENKKASSESLSRRNSTRSMGMESSVLTFEHISFVAGKGKNKKHILRNVSGQVRCGHVLASE